MPKEHQEEEYNRITNEAKDKDINTGWLTVSNHQTTLFYHLKHGWTNERLDNKIDR